MATKKSSAKRPVKVRDLAPKKNAKGGTSSSLKDITITKPSSGSSTPIMH
ncbi:MAG TPA: hypothetical protein VGC85_12080 [Chthoniobacterales bacterium]